MAVVNWIAIESMSKADESSPFDMVADVACEYEDDAQPSRYLVVRQAGKWYWRHDGRPAPLSLTERLEARARVYEWDGA